MSKETKPTKWALRRVGAHSDHPTITLTPQAEVTLGRAKFNSYVFSSTYMSRFHCKFHITLHNTVVMTVLNATNGVTVNDISYDDSNEIVQLRDGDRIAMGCIGTDGECEVNGDYVVYYLRQVKDTYEHINLAEDSDDGCLAPKDFKQVVDLVSDEEGEIVVKKEVDVKMEILEPDLMKQEHNVMEIDAYAADRIMAELNNNVDDIFNDLNDTLESEEDLVYFAQSQILNQQIKEEEWELDDIGVQEIESDDVVLDTITIDLEDDDDSNDLAKENVNSWLNKLTDKNGSNFRTCELIQIPEDHDVAGPSKRSAESSNNITIISNELVLPSSSSVKNSISNKMQNALSKKQSNDLSSANEDRSSSSLIPKETPLTTPIQKIQRNNSASSNESVEGDSVHTKKTESTQVKDKEPSKIEKRRSAVKESSDSKRLHISPSIKNKLPSTDQKRKGSQSSSSSEEKSAHTPSSNKENKSEKTREKSKSNKSSISESKSSRHIKDSTATSSKKSVEKVSTSKRGCIENDKDAKTVGETASSKKSDEGKAGCSKDTQKTKPVKHLSSTKQPLFNDILKRCDSMDVSKPSKEVDKKSVPKSIKIIEAGKLTRKRKHSYEAVDMTPSKRKVQFGEKSDFRRKKCTPKKPSQRPEDLKMRLKELGEEEKERRDARNAKQPKLASNVKMKMTKVNRNAALLQSMEESANKKTVPKISSLPKIPKLSAKTKSIVINDNKTSTNEDVDEEETYTVVSFKKKPIRIARQASGDSGTLAICEPTLQDPNISQSSPLKETTETASSNKCYANVLNKHDVPGPSGIQQQSASNAFKYASDLGSAFLTDSFMKRFQREAPPTCTVTSATTSTYPKSALKNYEAKTDTAIKRSVRFSENITMKYFEKEEYEDDVPPAPVLSYFERLKLSPMHNVISEVTKWPVEWLYTEKPPINGVGQIIKPMINKFSSIEEYESIVLPLMKLELLATIQNDLNMCGTQHELSAQVSLRRISKRGSSTRLVFSVEMFRQTRELDNGMLCIVSHGTNFVNKFLAYCDNIRFVGHNQSERMTFDLETDVKLNQDEVIAIKIKPVSRIVSDIRIFNAILSLTDFPLVANILDPTFNQTISYEMCNTVYAGCDSLSPEQTSILLTCYSKCLNAETPNISLIEGPPGTGKSLLITNLILQLLFGREAEPRQLKILMCAQSNLAVDNIASKLYAIKNKSAPDKQFQIVRYGVKNRVHPKLLDITIERLVEQEQDKQSVSKDVTSLQEEELRIQNKILQMSNDVQGREASYANDQLSDLKKNLATIKNTLNKIKGPCSKNDSYKRVLVDSQVVCCTLASCANLLPYVTFFDICIIDEATQCTEGVSLMPLQFKISSLILVGDTKQLPATVRSRDGLKNGFQKSLFLRLTEGFTPTEDIKTRVHHLTTQYRMNPEICKWPNRYFYEQKLKTDFSRFARVKFSFKPYTVFSLNFEQKSDTCVENITEAQFVLKLFKEMSKQASPNRFSYGIVTPYSAQKIILENQIGYAPGSNVSITTIDACQGQEKDIVIISCSRTKGAGFLNNPQRWNVAVTRARLCLIVCGTFHELKEINVIKSLLNDAKSRKNLIEIVETDMVRFDQNVMRHVKK